MFNLWFEKHPGNRKYGSKAKETFLDGGYYKIDLTDKISFISMNSMYFFKKQVRDEIGGTDLR